MQCWVSETRTESEEQGETVSVWHGAVRAVKYRKCDNIFIYTPPIASERLSYYVHAFVCFVNECRSKPKAYGKAAYEPQRKAIGLPPVVVVVVVTMVIPLVVHWVRLRHINGPNGPRVAVVVVVMEVGHV